MNYRKKKRKNRKNLLTETSVLAIITTVLAGLAHLVERHLAKVEVASSSLVARSKKETPPIGWCFFFGAGKFASQTYPAGELKSKGNRRCAASGGRSEPVSRKRRCLWFSKGHKQQCRDGVHPAKVSPANIPVLADNRKYSIFGLPLIEVRTRCLHLNTRSVF